MSLKEQIQQDLNSAIKGKKKIEVSTLRMLNAQILNKEKEKRYKLSTRAIAKGEEEDLSSSTKEKPELVKERSFFSTLRSVRATEEELEKESQLTNEEVIEVISSEIKKRKESILEFEKGERQDLVEKEKKEIEVLKKYLPEQLSEEEIKKLVKVAIETVEAKEPKDMGKVMAELMPQIKGKADGATVSKIVKELLLNESAIHFDLQ